jgi:hypothetical protein
MPMQIAIAYSNDSKVELEHLGFREQTVMMKWDGTSKEEGERQFFAMRKKPFQFCSVDFWGAGPD